MQKYSGVLPKNEFLYKHLMVGQKNEPIAQVQLLLLPPNGCAVQDEENLCMVHQSVLNCALFNRL